MGFFDFFKKNKKEEKKETRKIKFSDIEKEIKDEKDRLNIILEQIKKELNASVFETLKELKEKLDILRNFDLNKRKEQEKLKLIVKENLSFYTIYVEKLIKELEELNEKINFDDYINNLQNSFDKFKKNSNKCMEKATILVGKEIADVEDANKRFVKEFINKLNENKEILDKRNAIEEINKEKEELEKIRIIKNELENLVKELEKDNTKAKKHREELEKNYKNKRESEEFLTFTKKCEELKKDREEIDKRILIIKEKIELREILKHFHKDEKKSRILLRYSEGFIEALREDKNLDIVKLVKEAKGKDIENELKDILYKLERIKEEDRTIENNIKFIEEELNKKESEIRNIEIKKEEELRKIEKFTEREKEIISKIKSSFERVFSDIELNELSKP